MATPHEGWTHSEEMAWSLQEHQQEIAKLEAEKERKILEENHAFELHRLEVGQAVGSRKRRQVWRLRIAGSIVSVWLTQVIYSTYQALRDPKLLLDVEKIVLLVGITGGLVLMLINKVWPDNNDDEGTGK